jgi:hypothetical protein
MNLSTITKNWLYLGFGLFTTFVLLNSTIFPYTGFAILGILLALIFVASKDKPTLETIFWTLLAIILSFCLALYANPVLTFFNFTLVLYALSGIFTSGYHVSLFQAILSPFINFIFIFYSKDNNCRLFQFSKKIKPVNKPKKSITKAVLTSIITTVVIVTFVSILASANPFFAKIPQFIGDSLSKLNIANFIIEIFKIIFGFQLYTAFVMAFIIKKAISFLSDGELQAKKYSKSYAGYHKFLFGLNKNVNLVWPKASAGFIVFVFFITQIQLYLANSGALQSLGLTHQNRVQEVFFQLLVVALIVVALVFVDTSQKLILKITSYILLLEGIFLTLNALKSDLDYVFSSGMGLQRLYGFAVIIFTFLALLYVYLNTQKRDDSLFLKRVVGTICVIFVGINFLNFDRIVVDVNNSYQKEMAYENISTDAANWDEIYLGKIYTGPKTDAKAFKEKNKMFVKPRIQLLQEQYKNLQWQGFNLSRWNQYNEVKDLNVE